MRKHAVLLHRTRQRRVELDTKEGPADTGKRLGSAIRRRDGQELGEHVQFAYTHIELTGRSAI